MPAAELAQLVIELSLSRKLALAAAESCTGGRIAAALTGVPGASAVFQGGVVAYANQVKARLLGVREGTLERWGAVSEECAREMALGAQRALCADWAVATTGIAGPDGGTPEKPVGLVYLAWAGPGWSYEQVRVERHVFLGRRHEVQNQAVERALTGLVELL